MSPECSKPICRKDLHQYEQVLGNIFFLCRLVPRGLRGRPMSPLSGETGHLSQRSLMRQQNKTTASRRGRGQTVLMAMSGIQSRRS